MIRVTIWVEQMFDTTFNTTIQVERAFDIQGEEGLRGCIDTIAEKAKEMV